MLETYEEADGVQRCDNCSETVEECVCACVECGDHVSECACEEGPLYPAVSN